MSKTFEEIWCHKEIMGSKNANALWRAGQKIAQEADAALAAKDAEIAKLREELATAKTDNEEAHGTLDRLRGILTRTADALKGPPPPLTAWSWHDLPTLAAAMRDDTTAYMVGVEAGKDALRAELAEARLLVEDASDLLARLLARDSGCDADDADAYIGDARAFLARKEAK